MKPFKEVHTPDIRPELRGCEALGPSPTSEEIFDLYRVVGPGDPFASQYLRDAAARLGTRQAVVVQWPDGVAAILCGEQSREAVVNAYWRAINSFVASYIPRALSQSAQEDSAERPRKKRRYTKRKTGAQSPGTGPENSGNSSKTANGS